MTLIILYQNLSSIFVLPGTKHDITYYLEDEENSSFFDNLYNLFENRWVIPPQKMDYNEWYQQKSSPEIMHIVKLWAEIIDSRIDSLREFMFEYLNNKSYVDNSSDEKTITIFKQNVHEIATYIAKIVKELMEDLEHLREFRYSEDENLRFSKGNFIFKYLEKYGYIGLLKDIRELFEKDNDGDLIIEISDYAISQINDMILEDEELDYAS